MLWLIKHHFHPWHPWARSEWLASTFHTDLFRLLMAADFSIKIWKELKQQTILLFQSFLESFNDKVDCQQHNFRINYTTSQNAFLCTSFLSILCSHQFEHFNQKEIQGTLFKSKLFVELSKSAIPDTLKWGLHIMLLVSVSFLNNYLIQCYQSWGWRTLIMVKESSVTTAVQFQCTTSQSDLFSLVNHHFIHSKETLLTEDSKHTYHWLSSLWKKENNILVLLTWSFMYYDQTLEVLSNWINSEESLNLYQQLIEDLWLQQTHEQFELTLIALLCCEQLLTYSTDETAQLIENSYLTDFNAILNSQDIKNRQTVFEQMILSFVHVLYTHKNSQNMLVLLVKVLDIKPSLLKLLDGVSDQYCVRKVCEHNYNRAFKKVREELFTSVKTMLKKNQNADADWIMILRLSVQLISAL